METLLSLGIVYIYYCVGTCIDHMFLYNKTPIGRAVNCEDLYDTLGTRDDEGDMNRLVKKRHQRIQDIEQFCCINGDNSTFLIDRRAATSRWHEDFNRKFFYPPLPRALSTFGPISPISMTEVEKAINEIGEGNRT